MFAGYSFNASLTNDYVTDIDGVPVRDPNTGLYLVDEAKHNEAVKTKIVTIVNGEEVVTSRAGTNELYAFIPGVSKQSLSDSEDQTQLQGTEIELLWVMRPMVTVDTMNTIILSGVVADDVYACYKKDYNINETGIPEFDEWDYDTALNAKFQIDDEGIPTPRGGNVSYSKSMVSQIKIKRRFKGETEWKTIYLKDVDPTEKDALNIVYWDYNEPSNTDIEYSYTPVINGVDYDSIGSKVTSKFMDYFIVGNLDNDEQKSYRVVIDADMTLQLNKSSNTITTLGNKYPFVNYNGVSKYYSGVLSGGFYNADYYDIDVFGTKKEIRDIIITDNWELQRKIEDFLEDGAPKLIKDWRGQMWMVNITDSVSPDKQNNDYKYITYKIPWVESGDPLSIGDLYDNGFINTDIDRKG